MATFEQRPAGWTFRYYDASGNYRRSSGHATLREAKAERRKIMQQIEDRVALDRKKTFAALVEQYLDQHLASPSTIERLGQVLRPAVDLFGDVPIVDLTGVQVRGLLRLGLSDNSRWMTMRAVKQVLKFAADEDMIRKSPASAISNPQPDAEEANPFRDWSEVLRVEAELPEWCKGLAIFMVGTGLRPQEWPKLRWEHVDMAGRAIILPKQIVKPKTPPRKVPLRATVMEVLATREQERGEFVWTAEQGGPIDIRNWRKRIWYPALKRAGVEQRRPYDTRHTYAVWALRAGMNTFQLAKRMGTSLKMIDNTYGGFAKDGEDHERFMLDAFDELAMLQANGARSGSEEVGAGLGASALAPSHIGSSALPHSGVQTPHHG